MYGGEHSDPNVMYYMTVYNEPLRAARRARGRRRGRHRPRHPPLSTVRATDRARSCSPPASVCVALEAQRLLKDDWGVKADVWSVTRGRSCVATVSPPTSTTSSTRRGAARGLPHRQAEGSEGPVVAVSGLDARGAGSDPPVGPQNYWTLGADGFGSRHRQRPSILQDRRSSLAVRALRPWPKRARSTCGRRTGHREVPPARRQRRYQRQRGRRGLSQVTPHGTGPVPPPRAGPDRPPFCVRRRGGAREGRDADVAATHLRRPGHGDHPAARGDPALVREMPPAGARRRPGRAGRHHVVLAVVRGAASTRRSPPTSSPQLP